MKNDPQAKPLNEV